MNNADTTSEHPASAERRSGKPDWNDPTVPAGDAPPLARWPVFAWAAGWLAWVGFLAAMVLS